MLGESSATSYSSLVYEIGSVLEKEMGGSSGSLLSILFTAMSAEMRKTQVKWSRFESFREKNSIIRRRPSVQLGRHLALESTK